MKPNITFLGICLFITWGVKAQTLDNSFGQNGVVVLKANGAYIQSVAEQSDDKLVTLNPAIGIIEVTRFNLNGTYDNSFGVNGALSVKFNDALSYYGAEILIQQDEKILISGSASKPLDGGTDNSHDIVLARFLKSSQPDLTFGQNGQVRINLEGRDKCSGAALQSDGKIVLCGSVAQSQKLAVLRLDTDGNLDTSFNHTGSFTQKYGDFSENLNAIVVKPNGKIITCGQFNKNGELQFILIQFNSDGSLDHAFGNNGVVKTSWGNGGGFAHDIALQPDGKIIVGGRSVNASNSMTSLIARYLIDGGLDNSFGIGGMVVLTSSIGQPGIEEIEVNAKGKIYGAGHLILNNDLKEDSYLIRLNNDGSIDQQFSKEGIVTSLSLDNERTHSMILQKDGRILTAGYASFDGGNESKIMMKRHFPWPVSVPEISSAKSSIQLYPNPAQNSLSIHIPEFKAVCDYTIIDMFGHVLIKGQFSNPDIELDISILPPGTYLLNTQLHTSENIISNTFSKL